MRYFINATKHGANQNPAAERTGGARPVGRVKRWIYGKPARELANAGEARFYRQLRGGAVADGLSPPPGKRAAVAVPPLSCLAAQQYRRLCGGAVARVCAPAPGMLWPLVAAPPTQPLEILTHGMEQCRTAIKRNERLTQFATTPPTRRHTWRGQRRRKLSPVSR